MNPRISDSTEAWDSVLLAQFDVEDDAPPVFWPVLNADDEDEEIPVDPIPPTAAVGGAGVVLVCAIVLARVGPAQPPPPPTVLAVDLNLPVEVSDVPRPTEIVEAPAPKPTVAPAVEQRTVIRPTEREPVAPIPADPPRRRARPIEDNDGDWRPDAASLSARGDLERARSDRRRGAVQEGLAPAWDASSPGAFEGSAERTSGIVEPARTRRGERDGDGSEVRRGGEHGAAPSGDLWDVVDAARLGSPAGGTLNPAREADLMKKLLDRWPLARGPATRAGWQLDSRGNRFCMREPATGDLICLEPRGAAFVEVYVANSLGAAISYTREEALRRASEVTR